MSTEAAIFVGVALYVVLMIAVGVYANRKAQSAAEFIVAGRSLPMFLLTATIVATWFGGGAMMGASGASYDDGLLGVIADPFGATLSLLLIGLLFARFFRRLRLLTFVDLLEQRFGRFVAMAATFTNLVSSIGWVGGMLIAFGLLFESLTGTPMHVGIIGGALVVIVYTMLGGMWAVAMTDFVQVVIILVGVVVLFVVVLVDAGGWGAVTARLPDDTFRMIPTEMTGEAWLNYIRLWLIFGLADLSSQSLLGRALAARSERVAQNAFYLGAFGYLTVGMIPVLLGIIASVTMPGLASSESVIPELALAHLHPIAVAIFIGAVLAAVMSTCDSSLLASASLVSRNILPLVYRDPSDALTLTVARWSIPALASIAIVTALLAGDIYDLMISANVLMLAATTVPFLLSVWWSKANKSGAIAAVVGGAATWAITTALAPQLPGDLLGLGASFVFMIGVSLLTQRTDPPRAALDIDGNVVEFRDRLGTLRKG